MRASRKEALDPLFCTNQETRMTSKQEKIVGILGGMGPEATVDLMQRIIRLTPVLDDADHIRCIVDNNPKVPSRIKAIIEGRGEDPGACMVVMGRRLEAWGADFLAIACNTAHYYYDAVQRAVSIPVINMIDLVVNHIKENFPDHHKVGVLASPAVAMTGLYSNRLRKIGIKDVWPESDHHERLLTIIKEIKRGHMGSNVRSEYLVVCENLIKQGATLSIIACTELSVLGGTLPIKAIDAAEVTAMEIVQVAKNRKELKSI